jgi:hypothetical protein
MVSSTPIPLYPQGKSPWYPLDRRLGGSHDIMEKNLAIVENQTLAIQAIPITIATELSWLLGL